MTGITRDELAAKRPGDVVYSPGKHRYYRKGRSNTWFPVDQEGYRLGQQNALGGDWLIALSGPLTDASAECERLSGLIEREGRIFTRKR